MSFSLNFPTSNGPLQLQLDPGDMLFVLGANGTGKSSLMFAFNQQNRGRAKRIAAHRQTWIVSDALDMTPSAKVQAERQILSQDQQQESRYRDDYAAQRTSMTIYELIDAENVRARGMAAAYDVGNMDQLAARARAQAPIAVINELLRESNIPVEITIRANERVTARKNGGPEYSAAELSDGERNALLIAGDVLTAPPDTLLIIDEPERHLHRSIISPLLGQLFERRSDCAFVISTHDHGLPLAHPEARTLLLRSCSFGGQNVQTWEADEVPAGTQVDGILKRDLLGARRKVLFVEGTEGSLDKPLYSRVFPMVSVIPKGNCHDVEQAVVGARAAEALHWLQAFGIVDSDGFDATQVAAKRERGVYALPYYSVEALYFHTGIIESIASRQSFVLGDDTDRLAASAIASGIEAIRDHTDRLSRKAAKKALRASIMAQIPNDDELLAGQSIEIANDSAAMHAKRTAELDNAVAAGDWETILATCPVRESNALDSISGALGFKRRHDYQRAVRQLLAQDAGALQFVRALFGELSAQII